MTMANIKQWRKARVTLIRYLQTTYNVLTACVSIKYELPYFL